MSEVSFEEPLSREDVLEHFGVKGMHWGVWNEETRARRMGGIGRKKGEALSEKEVDAKAHEVAEKAIPKAKAAAKAAEPYVREYNENREHWANVLTEYRSNEQKAETGREMSPQEKEDHKRGILYDDFDQGFDNTFTTYLHCTGKTKQFDKDVMAKKHEVFKELDSSARESVHGVRDDLPYDQYMKKYNQKERSSATDVYIKANRLVDQSLTKVELDAFYGMGSHEPGHTLNPEYLKGVDIKPKVKHSALDDDDYIEHYGVKGMHWGVWNEETQARRLGAAKSAARKVGNATASAAKRAGSAAVESHKKRSAARAIKAEATNRQRQFDRETRKAYGLSAKKYKKLREATLKAHDPEKIVKGMHLLTDEELNAKIARMEKEDKVRNSANKLAKDRAKARQEKAEAWSKSVPGKLTNVVIDKGVNQLIDKSVSAVVGKGVAPYLGKYAETYAKKGMDAIDREIKAQQKASNPITNREDMGSESHASSARTNKQKKDAGAKAQDALNNLSALESMAASSEHAQRQAAAEHYKQVVDEGARRVAQMRADEESRKDIMRYRR